MKYLITVLILLLISLQYRLWISDGNLFHRLSLQQKIEHQRAKNARLRENNRISAIEVQELKSGIDAIEERARKKMGMIKAGETFFMIIPSNKINHNDQ